MCKHVLVTLAELLVVGGILYLGLSGRTFWRIDSPRAACIAMGVIGMAFCTISIGRFIGGAPAHPLSILGYGLGAAALLIFLTQLFGWNIPSLENPKTALTILSVVIMMKSILGRLSFLLPEKE